MSNLLEQASLVMIPSGYKEDIVYSVIPTSGAGDLAFTRASNGTRVNSAGLVEVCPWNMVQYSEDFTNAVYSKFNSITATADQTTAPNGTTTADKIGLSTASTTFPNLAQDAQYIGGQVYTFSVYLKKNTINFGKIRVGGTAFASSTNSPLFNLNTGVLVSGTGTIENVGNGWYRCSMTATADTSGAGGFAIDLPDSAGVWNGSSVYNVNDSIFAWGFMSNIGSTAKPYFATTDRLNVPRLTYQNGGGGCPSLLLEKQSTNLVTYSEQFDNAVHYKLDVTITANNITSPDGTQNADKFTETTGTGEHIVYDIDSNATGTYTLSAFFKGGAGTIYPVLRLNGPSTTAYAGCIFDTSTGAVVNTFYNTYSAPTTKVENMGNGWYRVSMTTTTTDANFGMRIAASNSTSPSVGAYGAISYTGSTSNYFYAYGAQLEASSYATSYIPTTSSSATRVADACFKTGISSLIGQTEGTLYIDCNIFGIGAGQGILTLYGAVGGNVIIIYKQSDNILKLFVLTSGTLQINFGNTVYTGRTKIAVAYKNNDFSMYVNGSQIGTSASGSVPSCSNMYIGADDSGTQNASCIINETIIYQTRLTNAELQALTS